MDPAPGRGGAGEGSKVSKLLDNLSYYGLVAVFGLIDLALSPAVVAGVLLLILALILR